MQTSPLQAAQNEGQVDRCKSCQKPITRDQNRHGVCYDCAARRFADYLEGHPDAQRAELMAEGRRSGLNDAHINLVMSIHCMNWGGQ